MNPKRIYVSGRIKDNPEYLDHFNSGCAYIRDMGYEPVNPCDIW